MVSGTSGTGKSYLILQHWWPHPPLPPLPPHQRRVQGPGRRETHQAPTDLLTGQVSDHRWDVDGGWTDVFATPSLTIPRRSLERLWPASSYTTDSRSELSDQGRAAYQAFQQAVYLRQARTSQVLILTERCHGHSGRLEPPHDPNAHQSPRSLPFSTTLHLIPHCWSCGRVQRGSAPGQWSAHRQFTLDPMQPDDAGVLEAVICLAKSACVMLTSNPWVDAGLVNGAMGTVHAICYSYSGPTFHGGTVPITPLRRMQLPLKLASTSLKVWHRQETVLHRPNIYCLLSCPLPFVILRTLTSWGQGSRLRRRMIRERTCR